MRLKLADIGSELPLRYAVPFVAIIYAIGLYGFYQVCPVTKECSGETQSLALLNNAYRAFALFFSMPEQSGEALKDPWLMTARWIAPCITLFGLFRIFANQIDSWWTRRKMRSLSEHTVLIGEGLNFAVSEQIRSVAINAPQIKAEYYITSDVIKKADIERAKHIILKCSSDSETLQSLDEVLNAVATQTTEKKIEVQLQSLSLTEQLNRQDKFGSPSPHIEVIATNGDEKVVETFLTDYPLAPEAALRGLQRVHLVIVGWNSFSMALLEKFARSCPYTGLENPVISIFCRSSNELREFINQRSKALADGTIFNLIFYELLNLQTLPTEQQIIQTDKQGPVTAILIADDNSTAAAISATKLRRSTNTVAQWNAPIYVLQDKNTVKQFLFLNQQDFDPAQQVIPLEKNGAAQSDVLEKFAKAFHQSYLQDAKSVHAVNSNALHPWSSLPQTYRAANRNAAFRALTKLSATGYFIWPEGEVPHGDWTVINDPARLEQLAEMEHQAWMNDRLLDGWRYGAHRNNTKFLHPDLVNYSKLREDIKELDRAHIRSLGKTLKNGSGKINILEGYTVGIVSARGLQSQSTRDARSLFENSIALIKSKYVSIASPLDTVAEFEHVEFCLTQLKNNNVPHRFLALAREPSADLQKQDVEEQLSHQLGLLKMGGERSKIVYLQNAHHFSRLKPKRGATPTLQWLTMQCQLIINLSQKAKSE